MLCPSSESVPQQVGAEIALSRIGEDNDNILTLIFLKFAEPECRVAGGTGGDSAENTLSCSKLSCRINGLIVADGNDLVDDTAVENLGDKTGTDSLNFVWTRSGRPTEPGSLPVLQPRFLMKDSKSLKSRRHR